MPGLPHLAGLETVLRLAASVLRLRASTFEKALLDFGPQGARFCLHLGEPPEDFTQLFWSQVRHGAEATRDFTAQS